MSLDNEKLRAVIETPDMSSISDYNLKITESWRAQLEAGDGDDIASTGVMLNNGDIIIAGTSIPLGGGFDGPFMENDASGSFAACRLDASTGKELWRWHGTTGSGNGDFLLAAGTNSGTATGIKDVVVLGGSTNGNWDNNATVSRMINSGNTSAQITAVQLDASNGKEIWRFQHAPEGLGMAGKSAGSVLGITGDLEGNFLLVGFVVGRLTTTSGATDDRDFFIIKLDGTTGGVIWRLQDGTPSEDDVFFAVATDSTSNVIAAGYTTGDYGATSGGSGYDYIAAKFSPDGMELWRYQSGTDLEEEFRAVTVDGDGNVYLAGGFRTLDSEQPGVYRPVVHKLDGATGEPLWVYEGNTSTSTYFLSIAVDEPAGLVVCAGSTDGGWARKADHYGEDDFALALIESTTGEQFGRWQGGSNATDVLIFVGIGPNGSLTVAGYTYGNRDEDLDGKSAAFAAAKFLPLDRALIAPSLTTPLPTVASTSLTALSPDGSTLWPTPAPTPTEGLGGVDRAIPSKGESGDADLVTPVVTVGAICGALLLCEYFPARLT